MRYSHRRASFSFTLGLLLAFLLLAMPSLEAQTFYGSVLGNVKDVSGAIVVGSAVTLTNVGTNVSLTAKTDSNGDYRFLSLYPGNYRLDISRPGFKHFTHDSITVNVQSAVRVDAELVPGDETQVVTVTAPSTLLNTTDGSVGQVIQGRAVEQLPLNGRNVFNLLELVPGVIAQGGAAGNPTGNQQNGGYTNPNGWGNYQIGGGNAGQSATLVDGASVNITYLNATAFIPTQDAVQEFRVATNAPSPEFGRFSGGVVNFITKSGTNGFHGTAYEYLRNKVLNANTFLNDSVGLPKAQFTQNQFGVNVAGPIVKDRAFFYAGWEEFALRNGIATKDTVPTAAEKSGDFRATGATIYDPTTFQPIQCNGVLDVICADRIDPTSLATLDYWAAPYPNPDNSGVLNFTGDSKVGGNNDEYNARVDLHVGQKQQVFGRYSRWVGTGKSLNPYNNITGEPGTNFNSQQVVLGDTYEFNASTALDVRASFLRFVYHSAPLSEGASLSTYGPNWASLSSQFGFLAAPVPVVTNMSSDFFDAMDVLIDNTNDNYAISGSLTKVLGRHVLKFGGELRQLDWYFAQTNFPTGGFAFAGIYSTLGNPNVNTADTDIYSFADYLLGYPFFSESQQSTRVSMLQTYQGYYIADNFQLNNRLALNYGLRWELPGAFEESHNRATVLVPDAADPVFPSLKGQLDLVNSSLYPSRHTQTVKYDLFAPRLGFAFSFDKNTVIRGGYGINYLPNDVAFNEGAWASPVNSAQTILYNSLPLVNTYSNPFPSGILQPTGRSQATSAGAVTGFEGGPLTVAQSPVADQPFAYVQQWNLNVERQLGSSAKVQIGYVAAKGTHLPFNSLELNQLPDQYDSLGAALATPVADPYCTAPGGCPAIPAGQLLRPFPQYSSFAAQGYNAGASNYQALQATVEKRLPLGALAVASYSFSKFLGNVDSLQSFLEQGTPGGVQDNTNLAAEWSLTSYDVPQRFVLGYNLDLPFGRGKKFFSGVSGVADKLGSGWGVGGITTLQSGFPLPMTEPAGSLAQFGVGTLRPNVVPGCRKSLGGSAFSRLGEWFNTACFVPPSNGYGFGDESRTDPTLRSDGVADWDLSAFKDTYVGEGVHLEFRAEIFNLFNRVQFGPPGTEQNVGTFGIVSSVIGNPRQVQLALRLKY